MADITSIFPKGFTPPAPQRVDPPELQLHDAMQKAGITPPPNITLDGRIHRFRSGTKGRPGHGDKTGWYIGWMDGVPAGRFGCWRAGIELPWRADVGRSLTDAEEMAHARRMSEAQAARKEEERKVREAVENVVEQIWTNAQAASSGHPYLQRKGIGPNGARVTGDGRLVLPVYDADGGLHTLQYIDAQGDKLFHQTGSVGGNFWSVGTFDEPGAAYVAEGFATACTIHEKTGRPCFIAYNASNLPAVAVTARALLGDAQELVIVGDNDESGVGQKYAADAAAKASARLVIPPELGDANDYVDAGHDLAALLTPPKTDWVQRAADFASAPAPISWLVKGWLQRDALIMVHGPSGGGKTFLVLSWCMTIAAGMPDWMGRKARGGPVVYLAGEGHHGLKGRVAAWMTHHGVVPEDMWLSRSGCDLNQPMGYSKVIDELTAHGIAPSLIVVDTLHRFLAGDENSAQDAKSMLDACNGLMAHFGCSVLLVHHTGVSEEAQHRARGSSAWRGALDIEISVIPGKDDLPIQVIQRKSKDAEISDPVYVKLKQVQIPGWFDEDGEPVTSAVIERSDEEPPKQFNEKLHRYMSDFRDAWIDSGKDLRSDMPYVTRAFLKGWVAKYEWSDRVTENNLSPHPDYKTLFIGSLLTSKAIDKHEHGWVVTDLVFASEMLILGNCKLEPGNDG